MQASGTPNVTPSCVSLCDPNKLDPSRFAVNVPGVSEMITQPLYDIQTYPNGGSTLFTFFQLPVGQSSKTLADTNMQSAGALPAGQRYQLNAISVDWYPGVTVASPVSVGTEASMAANAINDMFRVFRYGGYLSLTIGSKNYMNLGPLAKFPSPTAFAADCALSDATTAGASLTTGVQVPYIRGPRFDVNPIMLEPLQNWQVTIAFPTAVALASADAAAKIGVTMYGKLFRPVQ